MDVVVVAHPRPRSAPPRVLSEVIAAWQPLGAVTVWRSAGHGHAAHLARAAAERGADVVVAVGGDGTVNEVANGVAGSDTALAPVPGGSTNVFARAIGLPRRPAEAARVLAAALQDGDCPTMGAGRIGNRLFLANAGAGFDALVLTHVESHQGLKRRLGALWFALAAASLSVQADSRAAAAVWVEAEGRRLLAQFVAILHTGPYTYLGRWPVRLTAGDEVRGSLALVAMERFGAGRLACSLPAVLRAGLHDSRRGDLVVLSELDAVRLVPIGRAGLRYQVDGEPAWADGPLDVRYQPAALRVVVPRRGTTTGAPRRDLTLPVR